jgi:hypothetical protein
MQLALNFGNIAGYGTEIVLVVTPGDKPAFIATETATQFIRRIRSNRSIGFRWAYCDAVNVLHLSAVYPDFTTAYDAYVTAMESLPVKARMSAKWRGVSRNDNEMLRAIVTHLRGVLNVWR